MNTATFGYTSINGSTRTAHLTDDSNNDLDDSIMGMIMYESKKILEQKKYETDVLLSINKKMKLTLDCNDTCTIDVWTLRYGTQLGSIKIPNFKEC